MSLDCADSVAGALALRPGSSGSMSECRASALALAQARQGGGELGRRRLAARDRGVVT